MLFAIVREILQRIPFKPLDINGLYFMEYAGLPPAAANLQRSRANVRSATLGDLEGLAACQNTRDAFLRRFSSNDYCVVAVFDGRVVGYEWFCDKPLYVEERYSLEIAVPSDGIYAYDGFILPEHRLAGIWVKFQSVYLRELMQKLHRQKIVTIIDYGNSLSMNTHLRFGFKLVRKIFVIRIFGKSFFFKRSLAESKQPLADPVCLALRNR
jgi:GNAT superfamily N-acetyltransferase